MLVGCLYDRLCNGPIGDPNSSACSPDAALVQRSIIEFSCAGESQQQQQPSPAFQRQYHPDVESISKVCKGPCTILKYQCLKETKVGEETKVSRRSPASCCCCCAELEALSRVPDPPSSPPSPESLYILFLLLAFSHNQSTRQKRSRHRLFTLSK